MAEYEDTGLTPEEIKDHEEIFAAYRHACGGKSPEEIKALIDADEALKHNVSNIRVSHNIDANNPITPSFLDMMVKRGKEALEGGRSHE